MRVRLEAVAQAGPVVTLPRPPGAELRRHGLWRNLLIQPELNPRSMHLEQRVTEQVWHHLHGPPKVCRAVLDTACALLRALHISLPLDRVTTPTRTSYDVEKFVWRYGKKLGSELQTAEAVTPEGRLIFFRARRVLVRWFLEMSRPQPGKDNSFQWPGFHLRADMEGESFCENALDLVMPGR